MKVCWWIQIRPCKEDWICADLWQMEDTWEHGEERNDKIEENVLDRMNKV